jgi:hypothetical protein
MPSLWSVALRLRGTPLEHVERVLSWSLMVGLGLLRRDSMRDPYAGVSLMLGIKEGQEWAV